MEGKIRYPGSGKSARQNQIRDEGRPPVQFPLFNLSQRSRKTVLSFHNQKRELVQNIVANFPDFRRTPILEMEGKYAP